MGAPNGKPEGEPLAFAEASNTSYNAVMIGQYVFIVIAVLAAAAFLVHRLWRRGTLGRRGCGDMGCRCGARPLPDDEDRFGKRRETTRIDGPGPSRDED